MKPKSLPAAIVAAVSLTLAAGGAHATSPTVTSGEDLIFGIEGLTNTGGTVGTELLFDLGSVSNFLPGGSGLTSLNLNNDLQNAFSSYFGSNSIYSNAAPSTGFPELAWGVAGDDASGLYANEDLDTLFLTKDVSSGQSGLTDVSSATAGDAASDLSTLETALKQGTSESDHTEATQITDSTSGSWTSFNPNTAAFGTSFKIEQATGDGPFNTALTLYQVQQIGDPAAQAIGTFNLNSSGVLSYQAVPEPSTWATILGGGLFLAFFRRAGRMLRAS